MGGPQDQVWHNTSLITDDDLHLFNEGRHYRLYEKLGAHPGRPAETEGVYFALWAPNAHGVYVQGDFNGWDQHSHALRPLGQSGIWQGFVPGARTGQAYKYHIESNWKAYQVDKADPLAFWSEVPPKTASRIASLEYQWSDDEWIERRKSSQPLESPMSIYEAHLGSWRPKSRAAKPLGPTGRLAPLLADYLHRPWPTAMWSFMPIMEHTPLAVHGAIRPQATLRPPARFGQPRKTSSILVDTICTRRESGGYPGLGALSHFPTDQPRPCTFSTAPISTSTPIPRQGHSNPIGTEQHLQLRP